MFSTSHLLLEPGLLLTLSDIACTISFYNALWLWTLYFRKYKPYIRVVHPPSLIFYICSTLNNIFYISFTVRYSFKTFTFRKFKLVTPSERFLPRHDWSFSGHMTRNKADDKWWFHAEHFHADRAFYELKMTPKHGKLRGLGLLLFFWHLILKEVCTFFKPKHLSLIKICHTERTLPAASRLVLFRSHDP